MHFLVCAKNIYILNKNNVVSEKFQDFPIESDGSECHIQHRLRNNGSKIKFLLKKHEDKKLYIRNSL